MGAFVSKMGTPKIRLSTEDFPKLDREETVELQNGVTASLVSSVSGDNQLSGLLLKGIVSWSFEEDDAKVEINPETIEDLDFGIAIAVGEEIQKHFPLRLQAQLPVTTDP